MSSLRVSGSPVVRPSFPAQELVALNKAAPAAAPRRAAPSRPVESRPQPSQLMEHKYGQLGYSPNRTGKIGGAAELAQFVFAGYNGGKYGPVSITPATLRQGTSATRVHLVGISGTEVLNNQSTGWITNIKSAAQLNNPGVRNARDAILRTVPKGSTLVLAGHSQGGMIAQQLALDPTIKKNYKILSTVTYGSPLISFGQREGEVHRIAAAGDPVPRASLQSALPIFRDVALAGQQNIRTDFPIGLTKPFNGISAHNNDYTNERNPELAKMDALGRRSPKVPATLEFNPADRRFFTSPTHSSAK
jgi:hypothetical protein